jgi:hypothetical protein
MKKSQRSDQNRNSSAQRHSPAALEFLVYSFVAVEEVQPENRACLPIGCHSNAACLHEDENERCSSSTF